MKLSTQKKMSPPIRFAIVAAIQSAWVPKIEEECLKIATIGARIGVESCHLTRYRAYRLKFIVWSMCVSFLISSSPLDYHNGP